MGSGLMQIFYNILGGVIVVIIVEVWHKFRTFLNTRKFRNIFGYSYEDPYYISYGVLQLGKVFNDQGEEIKFPFTHPERSEVFGNLPYVLSEAQVKSIKYLAESFGRNSDIKPFLVSDIEIKERLDISYCSVGGRNNLKTNEVEEHEENEFFKFDLSGSIVCVENEQIRFTVNEDFDYGFIIKIKPRSLQDKTWIGVAGVGVWGTSGAAWFLARNWADIEKIYGKNSFGLIIKVRKGKDESAHMVYNLPQK